MDYSENVNQKYWASHYSDSYKEDSCAHCGASAYATLDGRDICPECAVNEYFEALQVFVDPMREGFLVKYDIVVDKATLEPVGFSASWEKDTAEGYYDCISIDHLNNMKREMES